MPIGYVVTASARASPRCSTSWPRLPFAVAGTVLAIGFVMSFNSGLLVLTGGPLILVLAYSVRKVPFAVRSASAIVHQIDASPRGGLDQPRPLAVRRPSCASSCR